MRVFRLIAVLGALALGACSSAPPPPAEPKKDAAEEAWYAPAAAELTGIDRQAEAAFKKGDQDGAAALITKGKAIEERLLSANQPTLAAMLAASDLDQLYGDMLKTNHNCGWATQFYQKNMARWKHWPEPTAETAARLKLAQDGIAACEKQMMR